MPCCSVPTILEVPDTVTLRFHPRTQAREGLRITQICVKCGDLPLLKHLRVHEDDLKPLSAMRRVNEIGSAREFEFPGLPEIASRIAPHVVILTEARFRNDDPVHPIPSDQLEPRLRKQLGFAKSSRPSAFLCPGIAHPIILHTGLSEKFSTTRKDGDHCRFVSYMRDVITRPVEVWLGEDGDRSIFHILGMLGTAEGGVHFMNIVVEADNHLCDTGHIVAFKPQAEGYRKGRLLHLGWGMSI